MGGQQLLEPRADSAKSYSRVIVCLAISFKPPSGRCVAGRELGARGFGNWIRPVSPGPEGTLTAREFRYTGGEEPRVLDLIDIPFLRPKPRSHQTENQLIEAGRWIKRGQMPLRDIHQVVEDCDSIWTNGYDTSKGRNDCIRAEDAVALSNSLMLIKPDHLRVNVGIEWPGMEYARETVRGIFWYGKEPYNLKVTDPVADKKFRALGHGEHPVEGAFLTISLTDAYRDGRCHKLIAAIIGGQLK